MLDKASNVITIVVFIFVSFTYGSWFIASFYDWDHGAEHGCLRLRVSPTEVKANIESSLRKNGGPNGETGRIETIITEGIPILLWVGNAIFTVKDGSREHNGFVKANLGVTQLTLTISHSGENPFTQTIVFKRVKSCKVDMTVYDH